MVDREARDKMAELLRHVASGRITHHEFWAAAPRSKDRAVRLALTMPVDLWEDIFYEMEHEPAEYRFTGDCRLSDERRIQLARMVLFLQTDQEYMSRPPLVWWKTLMLAPVVCIGLVFAGALAALCLLFFGPLGAVFSAFLCAFAIGGLLGMCRQKSEKRDWEEEPFLWWSDYEEALRHPRLLCGRRATRPLDV